MQHLRIFIGGKQKVLQSILIHHGKLPPSMSDIFPLEIILFKNILTPKLLTYEIKYQKKAKGLLGSFKSGLYLFETLVYVRQEVRSKYLTIRSGTKIRWIHEF